ncbi:MAG: hypothetical protein N2606_03165 [Candidatus Omnitrophica bacterium]|nr:hypothetical protein [Candidatus Omnitrophota bacterium]
MKRINEKARSFVVILMSIAIVALLLRIAITYFIDFTIIQNETGAEEILKLVTTALEGYANDHNHTYPSSLEALASAQPPYIKKEYLGPYYMRGYVFSCPRVEATGYTCTALPVHCGLTGKKAFTVTTGQVLSIESCNAQE